MRVSRLQISNYNCIADADINFDKLPSVVMIVGRLRSAGASSNGSGKSTILNALCWATFGKELSRDKARSAAKVIMRGESSCQVTVTYTMDDGSKFEITRTRRRSGATVVTIDGITTSTATGGQEIIDKRLGFSYDLFTRTVVFGGDLSSFCRMTPAARMKTLEGLLGIEHFLVASDLAKEHVSEVNDRFVELSNQYADTVSAYRTSRNDFRGTVQALADKRIEHETALQSAMDELAKAVDAVEVAERKLGRLRSKANKRKEAYERDLARWQKSLSDLESVIADKVEFRASARSEWKSAEAELTRVEHEIEELEGAKPPAVCPTCRRPWPQDDSVPDTSKLHAEKRRLSPVVSDRKKAFDNLDDECVALKEERDALRNSRPTSPEERPDIEAAVDDLTEAEADLRAVMREIENQRAFDFQKPYRDSFHQSLRDLRQAKSRLHEGEAERTALARRIEALRYWQTGFGRDGIPSLLLESAAPTLNEIVKPLADELTDGAYTITFSSDKVGGRFVFSINASNSEGGQSHEDLSKGEATRVDLCVLFAIRKLMQDKASIRFEQVFIDELFDGLDDRGIELAAKLLRSKDIAHQVVFISHDEALQEAADATIMVEKVNGVSKVKQ